MKNYIVLDLEWNQSPYGKTRTNSKIPFEIVEIGAVKLNERLECIDEFKKIIKPQVYKELHFKIIEVTHIDMQELQTKGEAFKTVVREFLDWCGDDYIFCTWGSMDLTELQRNMEYFHVPNILAKPLLYYDIQKLYSLLFGDVKLRKALDTVIDELHIAHSRPFHRALEDAHYTAAIMRTMGFGNVREYYSVDYYNPPMDKKDEIYLTFGDYSKYVSRIFDTREDALEDKEVTATRCYYCGKLLRKKIRWFSTNPKFYFSLAWCPTHGYLKGKLRIKKQDDGRVFVVKTLKLVDEEGADGIRKRQEELRRRRQERRRREKMLELEAYKGKYKK